MALCPGDTTQWDDLQRKFGNFAPKEKEITTDELQKLAINAAELYDPLEHRTLGELDQLEDAAEGDVLAKYRKQRLAELKQAQRSAKFGSVLPVTKQTFVRDITDASVDGQWVLALLVVEAMPACQHIIGPWAEAARRFPAVKFMQGVADNVMPGFPDTSCPVVLFYRDNDCQRQQVGIDEWGGAHCSVDCIEWVLAKMGIVKTELDEDPRQRAASTWRRVARASDSDEDSDEDMRDDRCYSSTRIGRNWPRGR